MKKQAVSGQEMPQEIKNLQFNLQTMFSKLSDDQKKRVANYLNSYNITAWLYNEILDNDARDYVDLSMQYVLETQRLDQVNDIADGTKEKEQFVVDKLNDLHGN